LHVREFEDRLCFHGVKGMQKIKGQAYTPMRTGISHLKAKLIHPDNPMSVRTLPQLQGRPYNAMALKSGFEQERLI
jgi:hypothetical protein